MKLSLKLIPALLGISLLVGNPSAQAQLIFDYGPLTNSSAASTSSQGKTTKPERIESRTSALQYWGDFDFGTEIVNLTPYEEVGSPTSVGEIPTLTVEEYKKGFEVTKYTYLGGTVGGGRDFFYTNIVDDQGYKADFWGWIGLLVDKESYIRTQRFVPTKADIEKVGRPFSPPTDPKILEDWAEKDNMLYTSTGGIMFMASASFPLTLSSFYHASGSWVVYVEKGEDQTVFVKIYQKKLNTLGMGVGVRFVRLGLEKFNNFDDIFSFQLDLKTQIGRNAYSDLVNGNIAGVQKLATTVKNKEVLYVSKEHSRHHGSKRNFSIGLPIIAKFSKSHTDLQAHSKKVGIESGSTYEGYYAGFGSEVAAMVFFKHENAREAFTGAFYLSNHKNEEGSATSFEKRNGTYGEYAYEFKSEVSVSGTVTDAVKQIVRKFGKKEEFTVHIPENNDLGFTSVKVGFVIDEDQTEKLVIYTKEHKERELQIYVQNLIQNYDFNVDPLDLCANYGWNTSHCKYKLPVDTLSAISEMYTNAEKMYVFHDKDSKAYALAFGEFGRQMVSNPFTVEAAKLMMNSGLSLKFVIKGEKLPFYERVVH